MGDTIKTTGGPPTHRIPPKAKALFAKRIATQLTEIKVKEQIAKEVTTEVREKLGESSSNEEFEATWEENFKNKLESNFNTLFNKNFKKIYNEVFANVDYLTHENRFILSPEATYFVRRKQMEVLLTRKGKSIRKNESRLAVKLYISPKTYPICTKISTEPNPHVILEKGYPKGQPPVIIGERGEVIVLCEGAKLGQGAQGKVYIGQDLDTGKFYAVKKVTPPRTIIQQKKVTPNGRRPVKLKNNPQNVGNKAQEFEIDFQTEREILNKSGQLVDILATPGMPHYYSIQELAWGENYLKYLGIGAKSKKDVPFIKKLNMFIKSLEELDELHRLDILHRDIKLQNIMWDDETETAKIVDMGCAKKMKNGIVEVEAGWEGTPHHIAPEIVMQASLNTSNTYKVQFTVHTDIYAAGVLGCEIFSNSSLAIGSHELFQHSNNPKSGLPKLLENVDILKPDETRSPQEQQVYGLLRKMVDVNPDNRANLQTVIPALTDIKNNIIIAINKFTEKYKASGAIQDAYQASEKHGQGMLTMYREFVHQRFQNPNRTAQLQLMQDVFTTVAELPDSFEKASIIKGMLLYIQDKLNKEQRFFFQPHRRLETLVSDMLAVDYLIDHQIPQQYAKTAFLEFATENLQQYISQLKSNQITLADIEHFQQVVSPANKKSHK